MNYIDFVINAKECPSGLTKVTVKATSKSDVKASNDPVLLRASGNGLIKKCQSHFRNTSKSFLALDQIVMEESLSTAQPSQSSQTRSSSNPLPTIESPMIAKTLNYNLPVKLNSDNYIYWKALVLPAIRALELEDFINGVRLCPSKFVDPLNSNKSENDMVINKDFLSWRRLDQFLLSWLLSTVSESLIGQVTECISSLETWRTLEKLFSHQSMARTMQLRQQLGNMKKGSSSVSEFVLKVKNVGNSLKSAGDSVTDRDLLLTVLNGVGNEFDAVVVMLTAQQNSISLNDAQYMLMIHEQRIEHLNPTAQVDPSPSANLATHNNNGGGGRRNYSRGGYNSGGRDSGNRGRRGRGNWSNNNNRPTCQICGRIGHSAQRCYNRFDRSYQSPSTSHNTNNSGSANNSGTQGQNQSNGSGSSSHENLSNSNNNFQANYNQTSAYIASPESVIDPVWYADSGASGHVTSDLGKLSTFSHYKGCEKLTVGSGDQLEIANIGHATVVSHTCPAKSLKLRNVLHVPHIAKNLLSISKFTQDNNAIVEFCGDCCLIKDKDSKRILLKGLLKDGLYQLELKAEGQEADVQSRNGVVFLSNVSSSLCNKKFVISENSPCKNSHVTCTQQVPCVNMVANDCVQETSVNNKNSVTLWHNKLGHPSRQVLQQVLKQLNVSCHKSDIEWCDACKLGKMHQLPFQKSDIKSTVPLELIFTDIWGPSPMISTTGHKYYISFVDDYTRFTWLFPISLKSEALSVFLKFKKQVELQFGSKILTLQSDMGMEFQSFSSSLQQFGITHRFSCAYTHQQNGVPERKHSSSYK
ncbi:hypothetical protein Q3G72_018477 [Acer saccharum]|nr:hypothetical protein Q3G72_018477 [Acer saccharum]